MGVPFDDAVIIRQSEKDEEPSVITVSCPDKTGLGSDICRIILFFGLTLVRTGIFLIYSVVSIVGFYYIQLYSDFFSRFMKCDYEESWFLSC